MINFRTIFNPDYTFIGIIAIILIVLLIIWNNHNLQKSLHQIGIICLVSSIFTLIFTILIKFVLNQMIPYQYKLFIQVISENVFGYSTMLSIIGIIIGLFLLAISKFFFSNNHKPAIS